jgi:hypothetical protein
MNKTQDENKEPKHNHDEEPVKLEFKNGELLDIGIKKELEKISEIISENFMIHTKFLEDRILELAKSMKLNTSVFEDAIKSAAKALKVNLKNDK